MSTATLLYESDKELIRDYIEKNSEKAANDFVRKYQKFVYSTALRYLKNHFDAEDISQEVFIKALKSLNKFRGDSSLKSWLYRITVNLCINATRKKNFLNFFSETEYDEGMIDKLNKTEVTPERMLEDKEFEERFEKILLNLPEKQRETFALRYFDELSYEEISKMLGTSVGGLKANYFQAVKKIALYLK